MTALRFSLAYGALFLVVGIFVPFWPLWLADRGLGAEQISWLLAVASWVRIATTPALCRAYDRGGLLLHLPLALALTACFGYLIFPFVSGFWLFLLLQMVTAIAFQPLMPIVDSRAMAEVRSERLDYGRIRLWGSLTFILATLGTGYLLEWQPVAIVSWLMLAGLMASALAVAWLPRSAGRAAAADDGRARLADIFARRELLLCLVIGALIQGSHGMYYALGSLHWQKAGLSSETIGWLWSLGVIAEILLFARSGALVRRLGPRGLLIAGGLAGVLRWLVLGTTTALLPVLAVQLLHAFTFAATHLALMHAIAKYAPPRLASTTQALNTSVGYGVAIGGAILASGALYDHLGGLTYLVMAGLCLVALAVLAFARRIAL